MSHYASLFTQACGLRRRAKPCLPSFPTENSQSFRKNSCYFPQSPRKITIYNLSSLKKYKFGVKNFLPTIDGVQSEVSDASAQFGIMQSEPSDTSARFWKMQSEASDTSAQFGKMLSEASDAPAQFRKVPSEASETSAQFGNMQSEASDGFAQVGKFKSCAQDDSAHFWKVASFARQKINRP